MGRLGMVVGECVWTFNGLNLDKEWLDKVTAGLPCVLHALRAETGFFVWIESSKSFASTFVFLTV